MKLTKLPLLEARIYVGATIGYDGDQINPLYLRRVIADYQRAAPEALRGAVRITETLFKFDNYEECGWEIGLLNYPRFPVAPADFMAGSIALAKHLLVELKQNRVGAVIGDTNYLIEADDAEAHPKCRQAEART